MIRIQGKAGDEKGRIAFTPRFGFRGRGYQDQDLELIYGHICPSCHNVIQALFLTPYEIPLWPYEETIALSQGEQNMGEIRRILPDNHSREGYSCYNSTFDKAGGGSQKLVLKNHILRLNAIEERRTKSDALYETGERPCPTIGIFSLNEKLLTKDFCLTFMMSEASLAQYDLPPIQSLIPPFGNGLGRYILAIGKAPVVVLVDRGELEYTGQHQELLTRLEPFKRQAQSVQS